MVRGVDKHDLITIGLLQGDVGNYERASEFDSSAASSRGHTLEALQYERSALGPLQTRGVAQRTFGLKSTNSAMEKAPFKKVSLAFVTMMETGLGSLEPKFQVMLLVVI